MNSILSHALRCCASLRFLAFAALVMLSSGCTRQELSAPPVVVSVVTTGQEHGAGAHAVAGKTSSIAIEVADDLQLKQLQCTYAPTGEYHSHALHGGGIIPAFRLLNIGDWSEMKSKDIEGTIHESTMKFAVPQSLSGAWKLTTQVLDTDGNIAFHELTVVIENDSIPAILPTSTLPAANNDGIIQLQSGETFSVTGNILDINYLQTVVISISRNGLPFWDELITPVNTWMFDMSQMTMPVFSEAGTYEFSLEATDRHGWKNMAVSTIEVKQP